MTTTPESQTSTSSSRPSSTPVHAFTEIGDHNQLNPLFARVGESTY